MSNISIMIPHPESFLGVVITKTKVVATCIGIEDYLRNDGEKTKLLVWECVWKKTGEKIIRKSSHKSFRISDVPGTKKGFFRCV